ncbi:MAG: mechanosensitive ion channel family protein [Crocinitomicaceae bacterium]|nr:mechanosensitive ion channel family protein [Crocinitomicaceae bacterium]
MTDFLNQEFYHNTIKQWAISFGLILAAIIFAKIVYWLIGKYVKRLAAKTKSGLDDLLVDKLEEPFVYGLMVIGVYWGFHRLTFTPETDNFFNHMFVVILTMIVTWLFVRVIDALIEEYLVPLVEKSESDMDDQLMPVMRKTIKGLFWTMGAIIGLNNAGFDVAALIAGLGIGGLALALAAQDTVKNIFGGIMVFIDKPFKIKDRIKIDGWDGSVEEVGVRSTRLRTLEGRLVTIPNGQFSDNAVENVTLEPSRKIKNNLGLTYDTTPENMEKAMNFLHEIVKANPKVEDEALVSFNSWGDSAMGILFIYYIPNPDDILSAQTEINMAVLKQFNEAGLEFAYPTQTIYKKELK